MSTLAKLRIAMQAAHDRYDLARADYHHALCEASEWKVNQILERTTHSGRHQKARIVKLLCGYNDHVKPIVRIFRKDGTLGGLETDATYGNWRAEPQQALDV